MRKSILSVAAGVVVLCAAAFTGYKVYENHRMSKFSDLMIKNLDVLTEDESWWDRTDFFATMHEEEIYDYNINTFVGIDGFPLGIGIEWQSGFIGIYKSCKWHPFDTCDMTQQGWG